MHFESVLFVAACTVALLLLTFSIILYNKNKDLKRLNKEIDNARMLLQTYMDSDDCHICLKDEHLKYMLNEAFIKNAIVINPDLDASKIIGYSDFDLVDEASAMKRRRTDLKVLESNKLSVYDIRRDDRIYLVTKFPVKLMNEKIGMGARIKDVTEEVKKTSCLKRICSSIPYLWMYSATISNPPRSSLIMY